MSQHTQESPNIEDTFDQVQNSSNAESYQDKERNLPMHLSSISIEDESEPSNEECKQSLKKENEDQNGLTIQNWLSKNQNWKKLKDKRDEFIGYQK